MTQNILILFLISLTSLAQASVKNACPGEAPCQTWELVQSVCPGEGLQAAESKKAQILPTTKPIQVRLVIGSNNLSTKSVFRPDCSQESPIFTLTYKHKMVPLKVTADGETGQISDLQLLSIQFNRNLVHQCDPKFAKLIEHEMMMTNRLEYETQLVYKYVVTPDTLTLVVNDKLICPTPTTQTRLVFRLQK